MIQGTLFLPSDRNHNNPRSVSIGEYHVDFEKVIAAIPILAELGYDKVTWAASSNFIGGYLYSEELGITADVYVPSDNLMGSMTLRVTKHDFINRGTGSEDIEEYEGDEAVMFLIATFGRKD